MARENSAEKIKEFKMLNFLFELNKMLNFLFELNMSEMLS